MTFVVFGLSISSAWGNGHATLLRGLFRALNGHGHTIHFFEQDVPYYAEHRDATSFPYVELHLYRDWDEIKPNARKLIERADVAVVTSYCPHGAQACRLILDSQVPRSVFYDMDTPVTLERLGRAEKINYLPEEGLYEFDLVLSYTGGAALGQLQQVLGARNVAPLYGWVDPSVYFRQPSNSQFQSDLAYLGTYAADRQAALDAFLLTPARLLPQRSFLVAGAMYPDEASWPANVRLLKHVPPPEHGEFYSSSPLMLSVTRQSMARSGFCPSGRLFESAACGTAVLSDWWEGLDSFFTPGEEILVTSSTGDAIEAVKHDRGFLREIGTKARERALDCHTAALRAQTLVNLIEHSSHLQPSIVLETAVGGGT